MQLKHEAKNGKYLARVINRKDYHTKNGQDSIKVFFELSNTIMQKYSPKIAIPAIGNVAQDSFGFISLRLFFMKRRKN